MNMISSSSRGWHLLHRDPRRIPLVKLCPRGQSARFARGILEFLEGGEDAHGRGFGE